MNENTTKNKSRHFTIVVRKQINLPVEKVFDEWTNPDTRRLVLQHGRYKNGVKEVNIVEGGFERYEDRWKNRLYGTTTRRYVIIRPAKMLVAHSEVILESDLYDQHFATQELLLFKPSTDGTEIVASSQCVSIEPSFVHAAEDQLKIIFDIFEQAVVP